MCCENEAQIEPLNSDMGASAWDGDSQESRKPLLAVDCDC